MVHDLAGVSFGRCVLGGMRGGDAAAAQAKHVPDELDVPRALDGGGGGNRGAAG